ncbi:calcium-binding protein [Aestuariicoccus sp. MJ-SS9]|uniref:calcium-binding protein n=1 Tax=Aestuariicoccus sp. MJ-SS9 TaxID=3079855 RepID=UPI00290BAFF4|nr:calcium-binding protein [Aestuariicoccus sp. MJ-SS9]MDU8914037.1 calcium-binding protein [Aestuariicoccus sp. MJ-SS9]
MDDFAGDNTTTGSVEPGEIIAGQLETEDDVDWFEANLTAGTRYRVQFADPDLWPGSEDRLDLILRSSTGYNIDYFSFDGFDGAIDDPLSSFYFDVEQGGVFYFEVDGFRDRFSDPQPFGDYVLSLTDMGPDIGQTVETLGSVTVGSSVASEIQDYADEDWFAATLTAGQSYDIQVLPDETSSQPLNSSHLWIVSDSGEYLVGADTQIVAFTAPEDGTYFLGVGNEELLDTGHYVLSVANTQGDIAASETTDAVLNVGATLTSDLASILDRDWIRVSLEGGVLYTLMFDADDPGDAYNYSVGVISPGDTGLNSFPYDETGATSVPDDGTYYVAISSHHADYFLNDHLDAEAASYTLSLNVAETGDAVPADVTSPIVLTAGQSATITLDYAFDRDWIGVQQEAGQGFTAIIWGAHYDPASGRSRPEITLRDAAGTAVADGIQLGGWQAGIYLAYLEAGESTEEQLMFLDIGSSYDGRGTDARDYKIQIFATEAGTQVGSVEDDILTGQSTNDTLQGLDGDDRLDGGTGDDNIEGGAGDDALIGRFGDDTIWGGTGNDWIAGAFGADSLFGGEGDDLIGGGKGDDTIDAGDGNDDVRGGEGDNLVFLGAGDDNYLGRGGNDTVDAGDGNDNLLIRDGNAQVNLGPGNDTFLADRGSHSVDGGNGDDSIVTRYGADQYLRGGDGNDTIEAGWGNNTLLGDEGDDVLISFSYSHLGSDVLDGGEGNDLLLGRGPAELIGGLGNDTINGGYDDDTMTGGDGADVFVYNFFKVGDADVITDFEDGVDLIRMTGVENAPDSGLQGYVDALNITDTAEGALIDYQGHTVLIEGVSAADLTVEDFTFL